MHCIQPELDEDTCRLLEARAEARRNKHWEEADRLRQTLLECGIQVIDTPEGTRWKRLH
jgi:cysteinyl-tRNA synthetase